MTVRRKIISKLMAELIIRINGEQGQGVINQLKSEIAKRSSKIKTMEDMVQKGQKYGFLIVVLGRVKYGMVTRNNAVEWTNPKDWWISIRQDKGKTHPSTEARERKNMSERCLNTKRSWGKKKVYKWQTNTNKQASFQWCLVKGTCTSWYCARLMAS